MYFSTKIVINGKEYDTIPYDELESSATQNEESGFVPGKTSIGDMWSVCVLAIIVLLVIIVIIHKIINFIYIRKTIDKVNKEENNF